MNNLVVSDIKNRIHTFRGFQVMLDRDLAELYGVKTKVINQAVRRNKERFPNNFMFQLTDYEVGILRSQNATSKNVSGLKCQIGTSKSNHGGRRYLPYVFTEQGVAMLSGVLKSDIAVKVSIQIINAFVAMRKFIASNAQIFQRLDVVERKQLGYDEKFEKVFDALEVKELKKGIFFDGQVFDAYKFVSDIVRNAKQSIILIDNFVDDSVLTLFTKRSKEVRVTIYTKKLSKGLLLDLEKYNSQYSKIDIKEFKHSHDRFIIIDNEKVYHIGASLKDLGKKWFAFSKFDKDAFELLSRLLVF